VFIAVGTPPKATGEADLSVVHAVAEKIGAKIKDFTIVATKSTVPVGTNKEVQEIIKKVLPQGARFAIASCPEFLREGQAISDTLRPDRVVIGTEEKEAQDVMRELHKPIESPQVLTNIETAEMIKYASNAFLATKISFANAIAQLSEITGADGIAVLEAVGLDKRAGKSFLSPGAGYGGSCFPKDVKALIAIAKQHKYDFSLLENVETVNKRAIMGIVEKAKGYIGAKMKGKQVGVLGLSFKPDTDDMRDAPSITIINELKKMGATIKVYDPIAMDNAKRLIKDVTFCKDAYEVAKDVDLLIVVTEWNEFRQLDLAKIKAIMKSPNLIDGRNIYDPQKARDLGFAYKGVGR
jgi:UDPglucose 6-dehydrogenase